MSFAHRVRKNESQVAAPRFESLEERLLLTTLMAGEFFIYYNSAGDSVRIDLVGEPTDAVELFGSWENGPAGVEIIDLVGFYNGDTANAILWPDGQEIVSTEGNQTSWIEHNPDEGARGARTEIWGIYFSSYSESTVLTISRLATNVLGPPGAPANWASDIDPWGGNDDQLPILAFGANPQTVRRSPEGSGTVIVGAIWDHTEGGDFPPDDARRYWAVPSNAPVELDARGVFPGGLLTPGITADQEDVDLGRIVVAGTLAGAVNIAGNVDVIRAGFLWADVNIGENLNAMLLQSGGGAVPWQGGYLLPPDGSTVTVQGSLRLLESRNGDTLYSAVQVNNDPAIELPLNVVTELEVYAGGDAAWMQGALVDWANDTMDQAQFISHDTGYFDLYGEGSPISDPNDWYAMPLMAGQTFVLDALLLTGSVSLFDANGQEIDSYGFETIEDRGITNPGETPKPMTFTAPAAGIYYLLVNASGEYQLTISNGTASPFGAVRVDGAHDGRWNFGDDEVSAASNFSVFAGGNIGAVSISGTSLLTAITTFGGGGIVAYEAGAIGGAIVISESNIGRLASLAGSLSGTFTAGNTGVYNNNAYIQNIWVAGTLPTGTTIAATGGIGVLEIGGTFGGATIQLNSDLSGPGGKCDLIHVHGDWGGLSAGIPILSGGLGSDFGFVHVEGDIYRSVGGFTGLLDEIIWTDGSQRVLTDDGGAALTVKPQATVQLDAEGNPVIDPITFQPITYTPTVGYYLIPVMNSVGGVIANLRIDGSATLTTNGAVQIGHLDMEAGANDFGSTHGLTLSGLGRLDVYYLTAAAGVDYFINNTEGTLVSGAVGTIDRIRLHGDLGAPTGTYGQWLQGHDDAPAANGTSEPQFGWFAGRINGLHVTGDINELTIDGRLHDLRVTGATGTVRVNADGVTAYGRWDGVSGLIYSAARLGAIYVGDGLADDGAGLIPEAGIFGGASIGGVYITGPRFELWPDPNLGVNAILRGPMVFGELNGSIFSYNNGGTNDVIDVEEYQWVDGVWTLVTVQVEVDAIGEIKASGGAILTANVCVADLDLWIAGAGGEFTTFGGIGSIEVSGAGAAITGVEIRSWYVDRITAKAETDGITYLAIYANNPVVNEPAIGLIEAGGPGVNYLTAYASGSIGTIRGLGTTADLLNSNIEATVNIAKVQFRDVQATLLQTPGTIQQVTVARDMVTGTINTGVLRTLAVGNDVSLCVITVAGEVTSFSVGGNFVLSSLTLQGPYAYLKSMIVEGNISGAIASGARIGKLISRSGLISATITTATGNGNVDLLQAALGFTGNISIAGSLLKLVSYADLGLVPTVGGPTHIIDVAGDLDLLIVGTRKAPAHLYSDINVGGDFGCLTVYGTYFGRVHVNGDMDKLVIGGAFGGVVPDVGERGRLTVLGELKKMSFNTSSDLYADLTVGGSISRLTMKGGSILGNLTSLHGDIAGITVTNGNIAGDLTAKSLGKIVVKNGEVTGDIRATAGNVAMVQIANGDLDGNITVDNGRLERLKIVNGSATALRTIYARNGIGRVDIKNGDLDANLVSDGVLDYLRITGSDINGIVDILAGIGSIQAAGQLNGVIRTAGDIAKLSLGSANGAMISAGRNIGNLYVGGNMVNTHVLAGYDVGSDGVVGGGDDNPTTGGVHSGQIGNLTVKGVFDGSVVAAGIDPVDGDFLSDNNVSAPGESSIVRMSVGAWANVGDSAVLADTAIDAKFLATVPPGLMIRRGATPIVGAGAFNFGPDLGSTSLTIPGGLTLTLTGAGRGNYDAATNTLVINGTTSSSVLTLSGAFAPAVTIIGADDARLRSLTVAEGVTVGDMTFDGYIATLNVAAVADGATWSLPGGVGKAMVAALADVTATVGTIGTWTVSGSLSGGSFTADDFGVMNVGGDMSGDLTTLYRSAKAPSLNVGADLSGSATFMGGVRRVAVGGHLSGGLTVNCGNLDLLSTAGNLSGAVNVADGYVKAVSIRGNFGGSDDTSFRAKAGIGTFTVGGASFAGLLSTPGSLTTLKASNAVFSGRVWSGGSIRSVTLGSMLGTLARYAMVAASRDLTTVTIAGNMTLGCLLAGFNPGDAGYDAGNGGEAANNVIDAFTPAGLTAVDDEPSGGSIRRVNIGGNMDRSTIAAGVGPGADGYMGTGDDRVGGVGTVGIVRVRGYILPTGGDTSYGVYAASNLPTVYFLGNRPFQANGTTRVGTMQTAAGVLRIRSVRMDTSSISITFNHAINAATFDETSVALIASANMTFGDGDDVDVMATYPIVLSYDANSYTMRMILGVPSSWDGLDIGTFFQLTVGDEVLDVRGSALDGEFTGAFPSGDGDPGGDFVYLMSTGGGNEFINAVPVDLVVGGGTVMIGGSFNAYDQIDVYSFSAEAFQFLATELSGDVLAQLCVFYLDDQGTLTGSDDTYEQLAVHEYNEVFVESVFQALELQETGTYYVVAAPWSLGAYQIEFTLSATDADLVADIGGLPAGEEIGYVSNFLNQNNNSLGFNNPKQLVYLDFDGGTATEYAGVYSIFNQAIGAFNLAQIDVTLAGREAEAIAAIVNNVMQIFMNTPASHPNGALVVQQIDVSDPADWAAYEAAPSGLWFTTVDPAVAQGLDRREDFTTVFIGHANDFGIGLLGIASDIDLRGQSKGDNAIVFSNNFAGYATAETEDARLLQYIYTLSNTVAHELGHTLGLNHHPTDFLRYRLISDDPDNNEATPNDCNLGASLMAYAPMSVDMAGLMQLGTADLTRSEFPIGQADHLDQLLWWFA